jgi:signal transduction histidine kinase
MQSLLEELNFSNFNVIETIVKYVNQIEKINDFVLIGTKIILQDDSEVYYEIYLKYTYTMTNGNQFTFLFNDVTRTKLKEKQTAEHKYKTLFLSKVAHEFKNPIICITELCKQMSDNSVSEIEKRLILKQVQSMSNYLLILVKDLNIFSESQVGKDFIIEKKETNVDELLDFCKEITESLILKANKKNSVELKIEKFVNFKSILSDEWRIKQVLLNLLSNAVKFTLFGDVKLVVSYGLKNETNVINFKVVDSGAGMDENFQKNLFKPFEKGTSTGNEQGSGLGLSIVRDICHKMGGTLTCESKQGIGSTFIVELPVGLIDASNDSNRNSKTVELVADNSKGEISLDVISGNTIKVDFIPGLFKQTFPVVMSYQCFLSSSPIRMGN